MASVELAILIAAVVAFAIIQGVYGLLWSPASIGAPELKDYTDYKANCVVCRYTHTADGKDIRKALLGKEDRYTENKATHCPRCGANFVPAWASQPESKAVYLDDAMRERAVSLAKEFNKAWDEQQKVK